MGKRAELIGQRFGKLTVTSLSHINLQAYWLCRCDCGGKTTVTSRVLTSGQSKSCGCIKLDPRTTPEPPPVPGARWIPLTKGKFTLIDEEDYDRVSKHRWRYLKHGYASRSVGTRKLIREQYLYRFLTDAPKGLQVDHIDRNKLDNRKINLRLCTGSQNQHNAGKKGKTSRYKGVSFCKRDQNWQVEIKPVPTAKNLFLGRFDTELEAAKAYDKAAKLYFGEFARLNFSEENQPLNLDPSTDRSDDQSKPHTEVVEIHSPDSPGDLT